MMDKIVIYTDGGCRGNPGVGGWGVWLRYKDYDKKLKGSEHNTTNNKMELTAAIKALEALKSSEISVDLYTDSKYVIQGINEWICLLYTSPSPRDRQKSRMPSSA